MIAAHGYRDDQSAIRSYSRFSRLLARWWFRIVLLLGLTAILHSALVALFGYTAVNYYAPLALIVVSLLIESRRPAGRWYLIGVQPGPFGLRESAAGITMALGGIVLFAAAALVLGAEWRWSPVPDSAYSVFLAVSLLCVLAVAEEFLFRGLIFQALLERFGVPAALLLGIPAFALAHAANDHFSPIAFANVLIAGTLLSTMYLFSRSLWMPIAFHCCWNTVQYAVLGGNVSAFAIGNGLAQLDVPADIPGASLLFGGEYGIEGGLVCTLVLLLCFPLLPAGRFNVPAPELAAGLFRRRYTESALLDTNGASRKSQRRG